MTEVEDRLRPDQIVAELITLLPAEAAELHDSRDAATLTLQQIGLSSLQVIQFATAVEARFGIEFEPAEFVGLPDSALERVGELVFTKR